MKFAKELLLLGIVLLFGALPASAADKLRVGKPDATGFDFAFLEVGNQNGIFRKYNLDIETISLAGGAKVHQAMTAGALDVALGSGPDFTFIAKGAPEKGVAAMAGAPLNMVVVVRPDSDIKSADQLKGRTIAASTASSLTNWIAMELSRRQGWGPEGIKVVHLGSLEAMIGGLIGKNVDSSVSSFENALRLEGEGRVKTLVSFGTYIDHFLTHVIFASNDLMKNNPDTLRRFLRGWFESVQFAFDHKDEANRMMSVITKLTPEQASKNYDAQMKMYFTNGRFDPRDVEATKRSLIELGQLTEAPADSVLFTEEFLP